MLKMLALNALFNQEPSPTDFSNPPPLLPPKYMQA